MYAAIFRNPVALALYLCINIKHCSRMPVEYFVAEET
jgi:hypothetical protein